MSGFVRHVWSSYALKQGSILSSNDEGGTRARAAGGPAGPRRRRRGPSWRPSSGIDVRTLRRDVTALQRRSASRSRASAAAAAATGSSPGFRVPPLMFTTGEAAAVTLGLMAARAPRTRGRRRAGQGPARPARPRCAAASSHSSRRSPSRTGSTPAPPDGETLLALADAARRNRRVTAALHGLAGRRRRTREPQPLRRRRPRRPLVRPRPMTTPARNSER